MAITLTPVLSRNWDQDRSWTREAYERVDGYSGLRAALGKTPDDVLAMV